MLVRFFRSSFAGQYIAAGLFAVILWASVLPHPPAMPGPSGPVILYQIVYNVLSGYPVVASLCGLLLTVISAFWLNLLLTTHEIIPKNSSMAAFLFILFTGWHPDQMTLTPVGITVFLFLPVLHSLFRAYNRAEPVDLTFSAGFMIAFSALFYLPSVLFYGFLLTTFIVYRTVKWREWAGSFIGLVTPVLFLSAWWFWNDRLIAVAVEYGKFFSTPVFQNPWKDGGRLIPALFLLLFLATGMIHNFSHLSEKTVETRKKLILLSWLAVWVVITFPFSGPLLIYHPGLAILAVVPFLSNFYLSRKKIFIWELFIWIFILVVGVNQVINLIG